ncbi:MAG: LIC11469 family lipoprotein adhesin Lsa20, partial [Bdellovibrionota bacterium]
SFSVAPHEIIPAASALGFQFQCLCNGTLYEVPGGKFWVRVLSLGANPEAKPQDIVLRHIIFRRKR